MLCGSSFQTMQLGFCLGKGICQNRYVTSVVGISNFFVGYLLLLFFVSLKPFPLILLMTIKMKRSFFQTVIVSILLYGCTTWTLTKRLEERLDSNYTKMLRAILNRSWRQHPTKQQLYGHLPPITKTIQIRLT